ncbi:MAG TPA: lytic transglycosylase domain-containing protein [Stellaceae bacterium]|nr:lytic transglycosylase domain-containing protein [Stellaceae bacterium]
MPNLLSDQDAVRYRDIFEFQARGNWAEADRGITQLGDKLLLAPVEAQRYLSPLYRPSYAELRDWLSAYADAPDAEKIYAAALKHHRRGEPLPARPVIGTGRASAAAIDRSEKEIGIDDEAARADRAPPGPWLAGLAAWRAGRMDKARHAFEALAKSRDHSAWTISAAAFWAARAELREGHAELVNYWLGIAAKNPRTFYGLLARRTLGVDTYIDFDSPNFSELDAQIVTGVPAGRRAVALIQVGETKRAEAELRALAMRASSNLLQSVVALGDRANMASLTAGIAARVDSTDENRDRAQYPVPRWRPRGGFQVDRALLYGLMRQESRFQPVARSRAGAQGLMQLMPETARTMAEHTGLSLPAHGHKKLDEPEINLALAQEYVVELLNDNRINGNLLYFAVAYNRGPNVLPRLEEKKGTTTDPLLFVESVTNRETRFFIHQVLTNYWIYRLRLGQPTPDLDALAAGEWPIYTALDDSAGSKIRHAQN